jgi:hypothetical protein
LRRLDLTGTEVLVATLGSDERPPHGVAGLVDFRLAGRLSSLVRSGFATGALGEVLLVPGKPKLPFDKILLFGVGSTTRFDERVYVDAVDGILQTLEGLRARTAVVELPGRHFGAIAPERAASLLLERVGGRREHDVWTLVDTPEAQRAIVQLLSHERRRMRDE